MAKTSSKPAKPVNHVAAPQDQWVMGAWNGVPMLSCRICQWDTLAGQADANEHARGCPRCMPNPPSNGLVLVADRYGNERPMAEGE